MHKSKMCTVWMAWLVPPGPIQPSSISPMTATHQHPSPTVRRDNDVIKDQVHISLFVLFSFHMHFSLLVLFSLFFLFDLFEFWSFGFVWIDFICFFFLVVLCLKNFVASRDLVK